MLHEIAALKDGWFDGEGTKFSSAALDRIADFFDVFFEEDLPSPHIFPTSDGKIQAEWIIKNTDFSLEIDIENCTGVFSSLNLLTDCENEYEANLKDKSDWKKICQDIREANVLDE